MTRAALLSLALCLAPAAACADELQDRIASVLSEADPGRWASADGAISLQLTKGWRAGIDAGTTLIEGPHQATFINVSRTPAAFADPKTAPAELKLAVDQIAANEAKKGHKVLVQKVNAGIGRVVIRRVHPSAGALQQDFRIVPQTRRSFVVLGTCPATDPAKIAALEEILDSLQLGQAKPPRPVVPHRLEGHAYTVDFPRAFQALPLPKLEGIERTCHAAESGQEKHIVTSIYRPASALPEGSMASVLRGTLRSLKDRGWQLSPPKFRARFLHGRPGVAVLLKGKKGDEESLFATWLLHDGDTVLQLMLRAAPPVADAKPIRDAFFGSLQLKR